MLFHLYGGDSHRLKGTCAFSRIGETVDESGKKFLIYAVAVTKVDKVDKFKPTKSFGCAKAEEKLDCVVSYYDEHREDTLEVLKKGAIMWIDKMCCVIPVEKAIPSTEARAYIAAAMKKSNTVSSFTPQFLKKSKTRGELNC
jgi:hypothetical protein